MCTLIQVIALFLILLMGTANAQQTSSEQSETGAGTIGSLLDTLLSAD